MVISAEKIVMMTDAAETTAMMTDTAKTTTMTTTKDFGTVLNGKELP
ncbi:hypothetical protein [Domibacillus aminovorans]|nr:hypothetical protein [Domibacillus aminovorans]